MNFQLKTHKAAKHLRWLHDAITAAAEMAVFEGDCRPQQAMAEVRRALDTLRASWGDMSRSQVLNRGRKFMPRQEQ